MTAKHTELEYKFDASQVLEANFRGLMMEADPSGFEHFKHDDTFYVCGGNVVRHRIKGDGPGELTVKKRKNADSLVVRTEVNLNFVAGTKAEDVQAFLAAAGYEKLFTLRKDYVDVFEFHRIGYTIEAALYNVGRLRGEAELEDERKFLEIEIKPSGPVPVLNPLEFLSFWRDWVQKHLAVGAPLNLSLFEHYSKLNGTNYRI